MRRGTMPPAVNARVSYLADIGVRSVEELLLVLIRLPLVMGEEAFRGADEPNPTGLGRSDETRPPPDRILEDRRTELPRGESSEFRDILEPVRDGGRDPLRDPLGMADERRDWKAMVSSA